MDAPGWGLIALLVLLALSIPGTFLTVNTSEVAIITRFGKFLRVAEPG
jgi:regulator of protease activity HflC (stomatin/prohibitin superfamily)